MRPTLPPLVATVEPTPEDYLGGWDPEASRLFVPALAGSRAGALAAVRIVIRGTGIGATVMGTVVAVRRSGSTALAPGVFLALQEGSESAASYLARVARGRPVDYNEREPRYAYERRLTIARQNAGRFGSTTVNVSESGCCVRWRGAAPAVGETVRLHTGPLLLGADLDATVCWVSGPTALADSAGLRVLPAGRSGKVWRALVEDAARSGAPVF
ncbi:MAG TPA: PilZ domain-containing protein [Anaeromyxobacteraceae bacterium]|nr:PilZ domain-containing protein [Anaeromyxobacteraceae bacterium]